MAEGKDLVGVLVESLQRQIEASGLSLEDLQRLRETAERIRERKEQIEELRRQIRELEEQIRELREEIEPIAGVLRDASNLRLVLVGLGLLDEETLRIVIGDTYKPKRPNNGKGKRVIYQGREYPSANALVKELAEQGEIRIPQSSYSAVRLLKSWANRKGLTIADRGDVLIIE